MIKIIQYFVAVIVWNQNVKKLTREQLSERSINFLTLYGILMVVLFGALALSIKFEEHALLIIKIMSQVGIATVLIVFILPKIFPSPPLIPEHLKDKRKVNKEFHKEIRRTTIRNIYLIPLVAAILTFATTFLLN